MQEFYEVKFFDSKENKNTEHYVFTRDIESAIAKIEDETPYVKAISWKRIDEDDLPEIAVVIQK